MLDFGSGKQYMGHSIHNIYLVNCQSTENICSSICEQALVTKYMLKIRSYSLTDTLPHCTFLWLSELAFFCFTPLNLLPSRPFANYSQITVQRTLYYTRAMSKYSLLTINMIFKKTLTISERCQSKESQGKECSYSKNQNQQQNYTTQNTSIMSTNLFLTFFPRGEGECSTIIHMDFYYPL